MKTAPKTYNGKNLTYEEVFRSAHAYATEAEAQRVLDDIRKVHDDAHGWVELEAYLDKNERGFVAVRHHAQYK